MTSLSVRPPNVEAVGAAFLDALARRDFPAMEAQLAPDIRFRALVPPGLLEESSPKGAISHFRRWFGTAERFAVLDRQVGQVGPRLYLRWHARTTDPEGVSRELEQHAYARVADRIATFDLLCSGFHEVIDDER